MILQRNRTDTCHTPGTDGILHPNSNLARHVQECAWKSRDILDIEGKFQGVFLVQGRRWDT